MDELNFSSQDERLRYLKEKEIERSRKLNNAKKNIGITLTFKAWEVDRIQRKSKVIKKLYGVKRSDVLKKVLLNLDDEDLINFLGMNRNKK
ncbi:hypothetical protein AMRN_1411 [Malaciobacter marinus]|uniref:Uncharacterized protein n=1 Tax=Malaciobacter marinus TaxID=505249 RepID=A0A347TKL9_9BACT|nr:hypothetical protein [Malaciobacter marinus]AXX87147.1 hypothetical protein AMRN_1411 [Malaciobacter marinus]PHO14811.1 hypothetical protein CPH92_09500 [Malaciobacter marinus]